MRRIELLGSSHDRGGFDCGVAPLNRYLRETARQHIATGIAKTFVLVEETAVAPKPVLGFFTVSLCQVLGDDVPSKWAKKLPDQIPALRLGRLAVARTRQGEGLGKVLLVAAIYNRRRVIIGRAPRDVDRSIAPIKAAAPRRPLRSHIRPRP